MRHSRLYGIMAGMLSGMLVLSVSSCVKDDFDRYQNASDALSFKVEVSGGWSDGASSSSTSIRRMSQSTDAEPLYLVTQVSDSAPVSAESGVVTRGTPVDKASTLETGGFGLSAICYTGEWPAEGSTNNWTTNFAHNLNVTKQGEHWKAPGKLEWPGSGNIRFFAYYPYSEKSNGCIAHSGTDATGAPVLTYTVPDDVKNQPDLLCAVADHSGKSDADGTVTLNFKHALTAVTIKTGTDMLSGTITGVKISGVYGKGSCRIGGTTWTTQGETRYFEIKDLNVALSKKTDENGIGINTTPGETVTGGELTFMMVPQTLPKDAELTINFTDDLTNIARTLTAKIGDKSWPAGKKVAYSINSTGIVIEPVLEMTVNRDGLLPGGGKKLADFKDIIDVTNLGAEGMYGGDLPEDFEKSYLPVSGYLHDVDITAYVKVTQASAADNDEAKEQYLELPFEIEYTVDGTEWKKGRWIPDETAAEAEVASDAVITGPKNGGILLEAQSQFTELRNYFTQGYDGGHTWLTATQRSTLTESGKGSKTAPCNLVESNLVKQESANCYIINDHGYYMFPVCYGNTYGTGRPAYTATPTTEVINGTPQSNYQLTDFVGYDDYPITQTGDIGENDAVWIKDVHDAVIIWQDSPDLVENVQLIEKNGRQWISFHTAEPALNQGNAVIAVRKADGTILWSWHIWATHYNWQDQSAMISTGFKREDGEIYELTPCNLGYCEPHGADAERTISMRFSVKLPDGNTEVVKPTIKGAGCPEPGGDVITLTQPAIAESVAGDNTYYQWGRKDPMLPGVYCKTMYDDGASFYSNNSTNSLNATMNELTMNNKVFYSTAAYRFYTGDTGKSIGYTIQNPHLFLVHKRPDDDGLSPNDFQLRGHWHNGENAKYKKHSLMNFWNSELMRSNSDGTIASPNGIYVQKTIYDPCPAGFKIPSPNAYVWLFMDGDTFHKEYKYIVNINNADRVKNGNQKIGWTLPINGKTIFFPATGVRNVGLRKREWNWGTTPAFADLTFIASAGFIDDPKNSKYSCCLFSIDDRVSKSVNHPNKAQLKTSYPTYNAYGFTLRPVLDKDR